MALKRHLPLAMGGEGLRSVLDRRRRMSDISGSQKFNVGGQPKESSRVEVTESAMDEREKGSLTSRAA